MVTLPFAPDPFYRITNVQWGGGVFAMASARMNDPDQPSARCQLRHLDTGKDLKFHNDGTGGLDATSTDFLCIAYGIAGKPGRPSFVACASSPGTTGLGYILHSSDGKTWNVVYTQPHFPNPDIAQGSSVWIVTWDGKQFWAGAHQATNGDIPDINQYDILLSSAAGTSWSVASTKKINFLDWSSYQQKTGLIVPHLDRSFLNTDGIGCPSCYFGQKQTGNTKLLIRPKAGFSVDSLFGSYSITANPSDLGVTAKGGTVGAGPPFYVTSVAYSGGWIAVGQNQIDTTVAVSQAAQSIDDGKTWKNVPVSNTLDNAPFVAGGPV